MLGSHKIIASRVNSGLCTYYMDVNEEEQIPVYVCVWGGECCILNSTYMLFHMLNKLRRRKGTLKVKFSLLFALGLKSKSIYFK